MKKLILLLGVVSMIIVLNTVSANLALGGFNQTSYLEWDSLYNFSVGCLASTTSLDTLVYVKVGNVQVESASPATTTKYTTIYNIPRNVSPNSLYVCDAPTMNITINCTFSNHTMGHTSDSYFTINNRTTVNMSDTLAACIVEASSTLTKANYTILDMNNTYFKATFVSTANGSVNLIWEPKVYTSGNGTGNMVCTNATVSQKYKDANDTYGMMNSTIKVSSSTGAKIVICQPSETYRPGQSSGIPIEVVVVTLVVSGAGAYALRRVYL